MAMPTIPDSNGNFTKRVPFFANGTDGWFGFPVSVIFTYPTTYYDSSIDSLGTAYTITLNTSADISTIIELGCRFKYRCNNVVTYGILVAKTTSTITLLLKRGTVAPDNTKPIDNIYYSPAKCPVGFSVNPNDWTIKLVDNAGSTTTPTNDTWWNPSGFKIDVLQGCWSLEYSCLLTTNCATAPTYHYAHSALSTSTSINDKITGTHFVSGGDNPYGNGLFAVSAKTDFNISTKKSVYILMLINSNGTYTQYNGLYSSLTPLIIKAVCAYL